MNTTVDFYPDLLKEGQKIIIYGASVYGELAYRLLECAQLRPDYYCDRLVTGAYMGVPVIKPSELEEYKNEWILIASADYFHEIREMLQDRGCMHIGNLSSMFFHYELDMSVLSNRGREFYVNRQNYVNVAKQRTSEDMLNFTRIQYVVSERCSLRCKDCLHLMQYYKEPCNISMNQYRGAFERLVRVAGNISEIRILGGEPFMNEQMYKIIEWWGECNNINEFHVYTNGTIIPKGKLMECLKHEKMHVHISDYEINREPIRRLVEELEKNDVRFYVNAYEGWADAGDLHYRNHTIEENEEIFGRCHARNCITFMYGKLFRCPRSAHAMRLGAMPEIREDYVDVVNFKGSDVELKNEINALQSRTWIGACNYCDGADLHVPQIPAGIQAKEPLEYKKVK